VDLKVHSKAGNNHKVILMKKTLRVLVGKVFDRVKELGKKKDLPYSDVSDEDEDLDFEEILPELSTKLEEVDV